MNQTFRNETLLVNEFHLVIYGQSAFLPVYTPLAETENVLFV